MFQNSVLLIFNFIELFYFILFRLLKLISSPQKLKCANPKGHQALNNFASPAYYKYFELRILTLVVCFKFSDDF